jgi:hypothetical protein
MQYTKDPQPWKEDPSELPEQVLRFRQVNQQVQQSVQQLQVIRPQQVIQTEAKEVGEIVQRPNETIHPPALNQFRNQTTAPDQGRLFRFLDQLGL